MTFTCIWTIHFKSGNSELILVFNPQHGVTCHHEHLKTGSLVTDAVEQIGFPKEKLYYVDSAAMIKGTIKNTEWAGFAPFQSNNDVEVIDSKNWDYTSKVIQIYRSSFESSTAEAYNNAPLKARNIYLLRSNKLEEGQYKQAYKDICIDGNRIIDVDSTIEEKSSHENIIGYSILAGIILAICFVIIKKKKS